jgi:hypothetical protein
MPTATPTTPPTSGIDHFLCYKARRARGEERFGKREVELSNQFQERRVQISKAEQYCNAVDKNGEGILNPAAHLTCYKVTRPVSVVRPRVNSSDQFGDLDLSVQRRRTQLCVPSQEMGEPADEALSLAPSLDHYELYRARTASGTPRFERRDVELEDEFIDETVELKKPVQLGIPTDKNDEGITEPSTNLTCYSLRASRFEKRDVEVENQFGQFRLTVRKPNMLCVPSTEQMDTDR